MVIRRAIRGFRRSFRAPSPHVWRPARSPLPPRSLPEIPQVNRRAGSVSVRPELSGLRLRRAGVPRRATRTLIGLAYRPQPSSAHRQHQIEVRLMNQWLRHTAKNRLRVPPPVLSYRQEDQIAPTRFQPFAGSGIGDRTLSELPRDLADLEAMEQVRQPRLLSPRLTGPDPEYLLTYRPLLPRHYRDFLRHSPYPRVALGTAAAAGALGGFLWLSQLQPHWLSSSAAPHAVPPRAAIVRSTGRAFDAYAPSTPGSVDGSPGAAADLPAHAGVGTEVVVY